MIDWVMFHSLLVRSTGYSQVQAGVFHPAFPQTSRGAVSSGYSDSVSLGFEYDKIKTKSAVSQRDPAENRMTPLKAVEDL